MGVLGPIAALAANRPAGGYGAILADCPWRMRMWSEAGRNRSPDFIDRSRQRRNAAERHYATMPIEQIKALPVEALAAPDCVLFLWAVDPMLPHALEVGAAWGFEYKTVAFYWAKMRREGSRRGEAFDAMDLKLFPMGTGYWTRPNPEQCLLFTRGNPKRLSAAVRKLIVSPRREHSRKPDEVYDRIEALVDGPYCEMFARNQRPGWTAWGNQVDRFVPEVA